MKTLMMVRHAKAAHGGTTLPDFDRPLTNYGRQAAQRIAKRLLEKPIIPQYLLSSPALRAKTTAGLFADVLGLARPSYNQRIYEAAYPTLLHIVNTLPDAYNFVALFGHNPGISELLVNLTGDWCDMPTCAVAVVTFEAGPWKMVSGGTGNLTYYDYPDKE